MKDLKNKCEVGTISYIAQDDYLVPNLALKEKKKVDIGKYGLLHLNYLRHHKKHLYQQLLSEDKLTEYLIDINQTATQKLEKLITALAEIESVTEELKATDQMKWVAKMNNIKNAAEEIVLNEIIYN